MMKHYVLTLNPAAKFEWERVILQNPITAEQPNFSELIAKTVSESMNETIQPRSGSYLIAVKLEVTILESNIPESANIPKPESKTETIPNSFPNSISLPILEAA